MDFKMSTHAQPISYRVFLAAGSFVLAYCLMSGLTEFRYIIISFLAGVFAASLAYITVYITEQYFNTRTAKIEEVETSPITLPFPKYREFRRAVQHENLRIISKRALEEKGICSRLDKEAEEIISYLIANKYVIDIGNSQYQINQSLLEFLREREGRVKDD